MIQLDELTFHYKKKKPLFDAINLKLEIGKVYGLLGKNGAGKTTLLKNMVGLLFPQGGACLIDGKPIKERTPEVLQEIFIIPEQFSFPSLKIKKYVQLNAPFYPKFDWEAFMGYLREFELDADQKLNALSHGQQKKVILAFGLATNTNWLIMDEPSNGLDISSKSQFRKIIASALTEERGFIISTHQVKDIENLIDNIVVLENGKIIFNRTMQEISSSLSFSRLRKQEALELALLYKEENLGGVEAIHRNELGEDSRIDLELLFKGIIEETEKINQAF
ncbi:ATP-binding cassette domain-containing protein [Xanthovirga aplysinae]|uniref:ABC transporter ATP-binding protein n=1 Tax=Xanthovirga aplysinae TaxID=2529853 RepID=UPI0012BC224D|nr:ABC transporter ATP-binding protein [Xanthovirga aplysinae]MTI30535.1 ABC transporter ATP-binding protein [Xanthovirga aplysinae]